MNNPRPYICRLCLFKSEIIDGDENYIESGQELGEIIKELFNGKVCHSFTYLIYINL